MPDVSNLTLSGARPGQGQTNEVGNFQMSLLGHINLPATLEEENSRLKKLLAEAMLDNAVLKDLASKKW